MKSPEKIYLFENPISEEPDDRWLSKRSCDEDVEYVRTDAYIEKAVQYLKVHKENVETEDNGIIGWIPDYFIEDFKKYMYESK